MIWCLQRCALQNLGFYRVWTMLLWEAGNIQFPLVLELEAIKDSRFEAEKPKVCIRKKK